MFVSGGCLYACVHVCCGVVWRWLCVCVCPPCLRWAYHLYRGMSGDPGFSIWEFPRTIKPWGTKHTHIPHHNRYLVPCSQSSGPQGTMLWFHKTHIFAPNSHLAKVFVVFSWHSPLLSGHENQPFAGLCQSMGTLSRKTSAGERLSSRH